MIRLRNAFSRLFRRRKRKLRVLFSFEVEVEGRKKPIKIKVVEEQPCPYVVPYSLTGLRSMTERAGGGDATRRIAWSDTISLRICWSSCEVQGRPSVTKSCGGFLRGERDGQVEGLSLFPPFRIRRVHGASSQQAMGFVVTL